MVGRLLVADFGGPGAADRPAPRAPDLPWIDAADLATILRGVLRARFPGVRFGVRTSRYAGGASVGVEWTGGPDRAEVSALLDQYEGRGFDGSTDSTSFRPIRLPDGRDVMSSALVMARRHEETRS